MNTATNFLVYSEGVINSNPILTTQGVVRANGLYLHDKLEDKNGGMADLCYIEKSSYASIKADMSLMPKINHIFKVDVFSLDKEGNIVVSKANLLVKFRHIKLGLLYGVLTKEGEPLVDLFKD